MNPEDNNPLSNPFATGGMTGSPEPMPGMGGMAMPDNLASAQDSLTAAGMAASQGNGGAMGLDQIVATDPNATTLPPVEEPLVPAAPVPGSIGSAVSMPPADPVAAPVPGFGDVASESAPASGAMSAPEVQPAPAAFNPFASASAPAAQPAPAPAPQATPSPMTAGASAPQPAPAPMPMADKPKAKPALSPLVMILGAASLLLLIAAIVFFVLWQKETKNVKPVYIPQISEENSNSSIKVLSCRRSETREVPSGSGTNEITLSYTGDDLSAYAAKLTLNFASEEDANVMREANAGIADSMAGLVGGTLAVNSDVDGASYVYSIASQDGVDAAASDVMNAIYGTTEGEPSLALSDVQAKYEAEGFICAEE